MLGAIAGLASREGVEVAGFDAAEVSYPGFADDLRAAAQTGLISPSAGPLCALSQSIAIFAGSVGSIITGSSTPGVSGTAAGTRYSFATR